MPSLPRFNVIISARAHRELDKAAEYISIDSPANAKAFIDEMYKAIAELTYLPSRFAEALEAQKTPGDLRQVLVNSYRVIYEIRSRQVHILTIRHAARRPVNPRSLPPTPESP